jgi:hypothetical protein
VVYRGDYDGNGGKIESIQNCGLQTRLNPSTYLKICPLISPNAFEMMKKGELNLFLLRFLHGETEEHGAPYAKGRGCDKNGLRQIGVVEISLSVKMVGQRFPSRFPSFPMLDPFSCL